MRLKKRLCFYFSLIDSISIHREKEFSNWIVESTSLALNQLSSRFPKTTREYKVTVEVERKEAKLMGNKILFGADDVENGVGGEVEMKEEVNVHT